jgi:hypothetical protein
MSLCEVIIRYKSSDLNADYRYAFTVRKQHYAEVGEPNIRRNALVLTERLSERNKLAYSIAFDADRLGTDDVRSLVQSS